MGVNVYDAGQRASALENDARQLSNSKKNLEKYRETLAASWIGKEVGFMIQGINKSISELESAIAELNQLAVDIRNTAEAIRQEELKQERIANAQAAYNQKKKEYVNYLNLRDEAKKMLKSPKKYHLSAADVQKLKKDMTTLNNDIEKKSRELSACYTNLINAQRS